MQERMIIITYLIVHWAGGTIYYFHRAKVKSKDTESEVINMLNMIYLFWVGIWAYPIDAIEKSR